jgi:hypothetical protein
MRFNEIYEAVRMGKRELSAPPKKDYTIGFEFEILSDGSIFDINDQYANFAENWHRNNSEANFKNFFNTFWINGRDSISIINRELGFDLQPKYGWASEYDYQTTMNKRFYADGLIDNYPNLKAPIKKINELSLKVSSLSDSEIENGFKEIFSIIEYRKTYNGLEPKEKEKIDSIYDMNKTDKDSLEYRLRYLPRELKFFDDSVFNKEESENYYWASENKDRVYDGFGSLEDIVEYFTDDGSEISEEDIEELLDTEYFEWVDDQIQNDWEYYLENNRGSGPVQEIANDLKDYVDQGVTIHTSYHESSKNPKLWTVEPDSSIEGAEVVSPVFDNLDEAFSSMNKVFEMIGYSYDTDETTGLHVNIGTFSKDELGKLDLLKFLLIVGGEDLLKDFNREDNKYTENNMDNVYRWLNDEKMDSRIIERLNNDIIRYARKMSLFNFEKLEKHGYIEVRGFGNAGYEKKGEKIENYVRKILRALDIAMDPNAYKDTYMKYLAKAIQKSNVSQFSKSDNRALNNYKAQYEKLINLPLKPDVSEFEKSIVTSYKTIINNILREQEYDMVGRTFYNTLSTMHSVMKSKDDGDYLKNLSKIIKDNINIVTEYKTLSSKKDITPEENNRMELIKPVVNILNILVK